ncbi:pyridine nucleotide-disulfide oxidoreductase [Legionella pneumophila]|uniref:pyridine nucleotide-disulfide oxidoreductase n=1 Tax=Legionella pneumophila TaxID=446 RepID=UPI0010106E2F|nr:pyridine nucleotide-disulfide oxidoreductase [Legionella pneumophila]HAT9646171.1 pyridine nucleotide-disulfide oxidoreductase [Legionella pneumophila subsp. pneumophila]MCK1887562.1 pyridine nucleotide-disulfide oxidoreductase [Legionella pneumophila]MCW8406548.1 pyridine nucleotide-disulfide oxidoreductase [Legionella pneumophila]RYB35701.1 pyridine nucleotide-disulfide oxidoreductase [Legionella pneumophila]RYB42974.1 pyridine nucleotide-disulfide oxidoreductase [Legionella pneumophila]
MNQSFFQWSVVGAGPAGIAAVGKLLDYGVMPSEILWIDPHFEVGDFGQLWRHVSSNTKVRLFSGFLHAVRSFGYKEVSRDFHLSRLDPDDTCMLRDVVEPLQWVTQAVMNKVIAEKAIVHKISMSGGWRTLYTGSKQYRAKNVILAPGAVPSSLDYPDMNTVPFDIAIDKERLASFIDRNEVYGVFGSSHSAIIIIRYLVELGVKKVINFYRSPCRYAIDMGDWILFDNTGLKGDTAAWARKCIDGFLPDNLVRYYANKLNVAKYLPQCNRVIYAVGFEKRNTIQIDDFEEVKHNPHLGILGPGLFGLGIAYPELKTDPFGNNEHQVGLWKFMVYLEKVLPIWFKYHV